LTRVGSDIQSLAELRSKSGIRGNRAIFTEYEREYCDRKPDAWASLGGIFCAKEACIKALSGFADLPKITFIDIEITHEENGRPTIRAGARLRPWMTEAGVELDVSISHSLDYAMATVIATRSP